MSIIQPFELEVQDQVGREKFRVLVADHGSYQHEFQVSHDFMRMHAIENEDRELWNFGQSKVDELSQLARDYPHPAVFLYQTRSEFAIFSQGLTAERLSKA